MKILIVRFSSIGDVVLTTPILRCLKKQIPELELHYLTKNSFRFILESNPYVDKVCGIESSVNEVIAELKSQKYDYVIDLHNNLRTLQLKARLGIKSFTFKKLNIKKWLKVQFKIDRLPRIHIVERYFEAITKLGITNDGKGLDYFIPAADKITLADKHEKLRGGYYALVVGGSYFTKQIPLNKLKEICEQSPKPLVLLGGKEDAAIAQCLLGFFSDKVVNACGQYNLNQSASIIQQAELVISSDTGLMHIASAFKKNIVSLWGNTIPEFGMYPYLPGEKSRILEVKELSCRPCSKLGFKKCPKKHFKCMNEIEVKKVFE